MVVELKIAKQKNCAQLAEHKKICACQTNHGHKWTNHLSRETSHDLKWNKSLVVMEQIKVTNKTIK